MQPAGRGSSCSCQGCTWVCAPSAGSEGQQRTTGALAAAAEGFIRAFAPSAGYEEQRHAVGALASAARGITQAYAPLAGCEGQGRAAGALASAAKGVTRACAPNPTYSNPPYIWSACGRQAMRSAPWRTRCCRSARWRTRCCSRCGTRRCTRTSRTLPYPNLPYIWSACDRQAMRSRSARWRTRCCSRCGTRRCTRTSRAARERATPAIARAPSSLRARRAAERPPAPGARGARTLIVPECPASSPDAV